MGKLCQTCGLENPDEATACNNCGTLFSADKKQTCPCESCGASNPVGAITCEFCGAPLKKMPPSQVVTGTTPSPQNPRVQKPANPPFTQNKPPSQALSHPKTVPIKKKGKSYAKSIIASIFYAVFCLGFFGFLLWLIMFFFSAIP